MKLEMNINCPGCGRRLRQRVDQMRPGRSRVCPGCGLTLRFQGDDGRKTQKALDDFGKGLNRISKGFKIKL